MFHFLSFHLVKVQQSCITLIRDIWDYLSLLLRLHKIMMEKLIENFILVTWFVIFLRILDFLVSNLFL